MPTTVTKIIDPDSGAGFDYSSLSLWEAGQQADLTASNTIQVAKCRSTGGTADTTDFTIDGWTTSATQYILIQSDTTDRAVSSGWSTSKYRLSVTDPAYAAMDIREDFVRVFGLQIELIYSAADDKFAIGSASGAPSSGAVWMIYGCRVRCVNASGKAYDGIKLNYTAAGTTAYVWNNIVYNCGRYGILVGGQDAYAYNNTVYGCASGIAWYREAPRTYTIKNCVVFGCTDDFNGFGTTATALDYCASDDGDGTNVQNLNENASGEWAATFTDYANGDFSLKAGGTICIGKGTDNPSSGLFLDDIDGQTRPIPWDIGADEYVTTATKSTTTSSTSTTTSSSSTSSTATSTTQPPCDDTTGMLAYQDFEGTGIPGDWTVAAGTVNWDYATSPAPLRGSQSMTVTSGGFNMGYVSFAGQSTIYFHFLYNSTWPTSTTYFIWIRDSSGNDVANVQEFTNGLLFGLHGTKTGATYASALASGTTYHIWGKCTNGNGDGILQIWTGTTLNKADATLQIDISTGDSNRADIGRFGLGVTTDNVAIFDQVRIKTTDFTSVCPGAAVTTTSTTTTTSTSTSSSSSSTSSTISTTSSTKTTTSSSTSTSSSSSSSTSSTLSTTSTSSSTSSTLSTTSSTKTTTSSSSSSTSSTISTTSSTSSTISTTSTSSSTSSTLSTTSSSSSSSSSTSSTLSTISTTSSSMSSTTTTTVFYDGACWGEQSPDEDEQPISWQAWEVSLGVPGTVSGDTNWGKLEVTEGTTVYGSVVDIGNSDIRRFTVTKDKYGSGSGNVTVYIRGSASSFSQHDVSPGWDVYSAPVIKVWRYVQLRLDYSA